MVQNFKMTNGIDETMNFFDFGSLLKRLFSLEFFGQLSLEEIVSINKLQENMDFIGLKNIQSWCL